MENKEFNRELEELLKDPAIKDRVTARLEYLEPEKARELAGILLWSDAVFSFGLLAQLPRGLNFLVVFLEEIGKQLQQLPPQMLRAFIFEMGRAFDRESFKDLRQAYAPLLAAAGLAEQDDDPSAQSRREEKLEWVRQKLKEVDSEEIRRTITGIADKQYPLAETVINTALQDPIIFANLVRTLPPLINHFTRLTAEALECVDYPPEILASAVFNIIDDLDARAAGRVIGQMSRLVSDLHEGSAVLGHHEPRFRKVLRDFTAEALANLDAQSAASAVVALGEDLETIFSVLADAATAGPQWPEKLAPAIFVALGSTFKGFGTLFDDVCRLPRENLAALGRELDQGQFAAAAQCLSAALRFGNRVLEDNPALLEAFVRDFSRSLDREAFLALLKKALQTWIAPAGESPLIELPPPRETAEMLNSILAAYNHKMTLAGGHRAAPQTAASPVTRTAASLSPSSAQASPSSSVGAYSNRLLEYLDEDELTRALDHSAGNVALILSANPRLARAALKAFFKIAWGAVKGALRRPPRKSFRKPA